MNSEFIVHRSAFIVVLFVLSVLILGCNLNDGILQRAQEYFPLRDSTEWTYRHEDGTTSKLFVRGDSSAFNHPCIVVEEDAAEQYWFKGGGEVRKFVDYVVNINGTDYPLEQRYRRYYVLPLVAGSSWSEDFNDRVPVLGDTIAFLHTISGRVAGTATVQVPYGSFAQCYEVDITETVMQDSVTTTTIAQEWYAPDIGLVKRIQGASVEELENYQSP